MGIRYGRSLKPLVGTAPNLVSGRVKTEKMLCTQAVTVPSTAS
jgi:hypothetical protein